MAERMKKKKWSRSWTIFGLLLIILIVNQIPLPYYYSQPGEANALEDIIMVEGGEGEEGEFYITTILQRRANIPLYVWAQISPYREVTPTDSYLMDGETDDEYFHRQEMMMTSSQEASKLVAYREAGLEPDIEYEGIRVTEVIDGMDAADHLQEGDLITSVNGTDVNTLEELNAELENVEIGTEVTVDLTREEEAETASVAIDMFPEEMDSEGRGGLGLLFPYTERSIEFDPEVDIEAGSIGGPSAGLMFALEIYNQLTPDDLTKGLKVAGTGTIDDEGNIGRIGGIEQKVVAAEESEVDIFFAPEDDLDSPSNYELAIDTAADINAEMEVVGVRTFDEAAAYLEDYTPS
ncbi:PDZ domain-containing protein [Sinobaca qinghaiensis]|uniref:endopeptidase La n=1 Tax=Sinobaca qinghaiensis TaxID=342944 RepID=A0A419V654_9BACL|nr:SepM family pheromone-processing serine protease [Sinobaca qinghaiensis]RKD75465.1 PDZ domain-containing protein [Sinobaca qinghaiensis]